MTHFERIRNDFHACRMTRADAMAALMAGAGGKSRVNADRFLRCLPPADTNVPSDYWGDPCARGPEPACDCR